MSVKYDKEFINVSESINDNTFHLDVSSIKPGKTTITIEGDILSENGRIEKKQSNIELYIHNSGIITINGFLGKCEGGVSFIISFYFIMLVIIVYLLNYYRHRIKKNLYSYKNVTLLGLTIFMSIQLIYNLFFFIYDFYNGYISQSVNSLISSMQEGINITTILVLPLAFFVTILVTISNFKLLEKEGKSWRNMLGIILGSFICLSTIIVTFFRALTFNLNILNAYLYIVIFSSIAYLECILLATIIIGIKAAKRIPNFDKDCIIILGCKVKKDGTLTNLLKSRVDRAIEFNNMQKKLTEKNIIFVPSGGQGNDEVISEAQAMKNYLIDQGIKEDYILIEDKSTNTFENIRNSNEIIKKTIKDAKIAFCTTNYHVLRAGIIANSQNIDVEGIGAKTKSYYWINAFIREFVATLVSEKKTHVKILLILDFIILAFTLVSFLSTIL